MWFKIVLIVLFAIGPIVDIVQIDEPREPKTKEYAAVSLVLNAAMIVGLLYFWR